MEKDLASAVEKLSTPEEKVFKVDLGLFSVTGSAENILELLMTRQMPLEIVKIEVKE